MEIWLDKEELRARKQGSEVTSEAQAPGVDVAAPACQQAEEVQPPAAEDSPPQPAPAMPTASVMFERFHPLAFLFSGIGFILTFVAVLAGLAVALHFPYFMAAGVPDPDLPAYLDRTFGDSNWPKLMMDMGMVIVFALILPAAVFVSMGRRHLGARHLIRGVLGLAGLLAAVTLLSDGISYSFGRAQLNPTLGSPKIGPIIECLLKGLQNEEAVFAAIIFVISVVILAWPARPRKMMLTPALNQGIS